MNLLILNQRL